MALRHILFTEHTPGSIQVSEPRRTCCEVSKPDAKQVLELVDDVVDDLIVVRLRMQQ